MSSPFPLSFARVRENLHVVLAMSPIGESLRNRTRMYPGLVNCTTIDWFQQWPADALVEVATKFIQDIPVCGLLESRAELGMAEYLCKQIRYH